MGEAGSGEEADEALLAATRAGDLEAFETLVKRYQPRIVHFLHRLVGDYARAEELAQETFLRVFRAADQYSEEWRFSTWIYTIARNLAKNELRWKSRHPEEPAADLADEGSGGVLRVLATGRDAGRPDEPLAREELERALTAALAVLPEKHRVVLLLAEVESWSYDEIGRLMGRPRGTIKSWIYRAKRVLIKELKDREVFE